MHAMHMQQKIVKRTIIYLKYNFQLYRYDIGRTYYRWRIQFFSVEGGL